MATYTPYDWSPGDTITAARLDNLETSAASAVTDAGSLSDVSHNVIHEKDAGSGVTVDSLLIKDGYPRANLGSTIAASDTLLASNDTAHGEGGSTTYVLVKEIKVPAWIRSATLRIKFDLKVANGAYIAYGKIYKNAVPWGTEQTEEDGNYATKTEDLAGFANGDIVSLYVKTNDGGVGAYAANFRIYGTITTEAADITDPWLAPLTGE